MEQDKESETNPFIKSYSQNLTKKTDDKKIDLPNSTTYKKTKQSKVKPNREIKILLLLFFVCLAAVGGFFYVQSKSNASSSNKNLRFTTTARQSLYIGYMAIDHIYQDQVKEAEKNMLQLLKIARNIYETVGKLDEVKPMLQSIHPSSNIRLKADQLLAELQEDMKKNNDIIEKAKKAEKARDWKQVINTLKGISKTRYWQQQAKVMIDNAKQQLQPTAQQPVVTFPVQTKEEYTYTSPPNQEDTSSQVYPPYYNPSPVEPQKTPSEPPQEQFNLPKAK
jgi:hypothetical protein